MPREIKESDWKLLKQLHPVALERFSKRILSEIGSINADSAKGFHQRYLDIFEVIGRRDREMSQLFNDLRRSTALFQIAYIQSRGLLTEEEFSRFSEETRSFVEVMLEGQHDDDE
ncbi:MAG: hypothetical protein A2Z65_11465 [Gallionellales bacterium RIFCSPLOWO2_02_58_13]|nr:MAG: hypothetical protein A2Z65_11465 [Gallionellales bacterium RIFCSPLOWO2_02_58_13]